MGRPDASDEDAWKLAKGRGGKGMTVAKTSVGLDKPKCGGKTRTGAHCTRPAGWGTKHVGVGRCKLHGGKTKTHEKSGQLQLAKQAAELLSIPVETNPFDALLKTLAEAQGYVNYFRRQVQALDPDMVYVRPTSVLRRPLDEGKEGENPGVEVEEITEGPEDLNIAIKGHFQAMEMLHRLGKTIVQLGLAERMVQVQETHSQFIVGAIQGIFRELGISLDAKAMVVIRKHLEIVESTAEEVDGDEG